MAQLRTARETAAMILRAFLITALTLSAHAEPVSYHREIAPIFRANCVSCHKPEKAKGDLDLTTVEAALKGGKHEGNIVPGKPDESGLVESISGHEPEMPKEGEPLNPAEIALIRRWIAEGAKADSPSAVSRRPVSPPVYKTLPAIPAIAYSPDGTLLAIAGHHEVILRSADGAQVVARLIGDAPRVESLAFSTDGKLLAACGGAPSEFGEIQIWDVAARSLIRSIKTSNDTVYGVSFSPDATRVAVGCADKIIRAFSVTDGKQVMQCDNHIDWVFATAWSLDGTKVATASRDKALKLIDVATGHLIDDINQPREPLFALARSPKADVIVSGGENGQIYLHRMEPRGGRLSEGDNKELSAIKEVERLPGPAAAVAWSADGTRIAAGGTRGEVRVWAAPEGKRLCSLKETLPSVYALAFAPDDARLAVACADGKIRVFDPSKGEKLTEFDSVPLTP
jgi:WD40 repeat protein/mono/diheme cytochrome c family protein